MSGNAEAQPSPDEMARIADAPPCCFRCWRRDELSELRERIQRRALERRARAGKGRPLWYRRLRWRELAATVDWEVINR